MRDHLVDDGVRVLVLVHLEGTLKGQSEGVVAVPVVEVAAERVGEGTVGTEVPRGTEGVAAAAALHEHLFVDQDFRENQINHKIKEPWISLQINDLYFSQVQQSLNAPYSE